MGSGAARAIGPATVEPSRPIPAQAIIQPGCTSQTFPGARFGYMDGEIRLGYQLAEICLQTHLYGRQWLNVQHHLQRSPNRGSWEQRRKNRLQGPTSDEPQPSWYRDPGSAQPAQLLRWGL